MIERVFNNGDVMVFKMISGEEVIAKTESSSDFPKSLLVRHPHVVSTNGEAFALLPYIITADEDKITEINVDSIAAITTPIEGIATAYLERTSGIQLIK